MNQYSSKLHSDLILGRSRKLHALKSLFFKIFLVCIQNADFILPSVLDSQACLIYPHILCAEFIFNSMDFTFIQFANYNFVLGISMK